MQKDQPVRIEVGKRYYDRTGMIFQIFRSLLPGDPGYSDGYRFRGVSTPIDPDAPNAVTITRSFKSDGTQFPNGTNLASIPSDLVGEVVKTKPCIFGEDLDFVRRLISLEILQAISSYVTSSMNVGDMNREVDTIADQIIDRINEYRNRKA